MFYVGTTKSPKKSNLHSFGWTSLHSVWMLVRTSQLISNIS